jgi:hypothetical protein
MFQGTGDDQREEAFDLGRDVRDAVAQRTGRRFVALFALGFEAVLIDDGRKRYSMEVPDVPARMDEAVGRAAARRRSLRHWIVLDQQSGTSFVIPVQEAHQIVNTQAA